MSDGNRRWKTVHGRLLRVHEVQTCGMSRAALAVVIAMVVTSGAASARAQTRTASFQPDPAVIASLGQTNTIGLRLDDATGVSGFAFGVTFDPAIMHVSGATLGSLVASSNCAAFSTSVDNVAGRLCVVFACASPPTGGGTIVDIAVQTQAFGTSPLTFDAAACPAGSAPGGCRLDEGIPACSVDHGEIMVVPPPTSTPVPASATPTATGMATPTATPLCGNGNVDISPGEQCDDGNAVSGDCCSSTCQLEPAGQSCNDQNPCTTGETCNTTGVCSEATSCNTAVTCNLCGSQCTLNGGVCKCG